MDRIESFDILKGIGIILMIVAHTYGPNNIIWNFIYAFHMPLFFIVSGYFYKQKTFSLLIKKNSNQLLAPYITLCLIVTALTQLRQPHEIQNDINSTLYGMGPAWFLLAMFMVRLEFHYILHFFPKKYLLVSLFISTTTCFIANYQGLSSFLSFYPSLASLFFVAIGYYIRMHSLLDQTKEQSNIFLFVGLLFWLTTSLYGKVDMSQCTFKLSLVDFCGSIGGTFLLFKLSLLIDKYNSRIREILINAGKYSLVILFFHSIDYCIPVWYVIEPYLPSTFLLFIILIIRLLFITICVSITLREKWAREFFRIKL